MKNKPSSFKKKFFFTAPHTRMQSVLMTMFKHTQVVRKFPPVACILANYTPGLTVLRLTYLHFLTRKKVSKNTQNRIAE